eukprot:9669658-Heterocapsa_arctica.AAC.1
MDGMTFRFEPQKRFLCPSWKESASPTFILHGSEASLEQRQEELRLRAAPRLRTHIESHGGNSSPGMADPDATDAVAHPRAERALHGAGREQPSGLPDPVDGRAT